MLYKVLSKEKLGELVTNLLSNYEFYGPKKIDKVTHDFVLIENFSDIDLSYKKTTIPPSKKLLFPSYENLINYKLNKDNVEVLPNLESKKRILFGVAPWDINGMNFLDKIFSIDYLDNNYLMKRKNLIVIGFDVEPSDNNFAAAVNAEYTNKGFDLYITDLKDRYFIRVGSATGNFIINNFTTAVDAKLKDFEDYNRFLDVYRKKFKVKINLDKFYDSFEAVYSNNELWDKLAKNCFSCGSCNLVCPTCFCFNVKDELMLNLKEGIKKREWDSCMISDYGLVAGGHNFRPTNSNRLKQRYRCKLKTFAEKFESISCVGCGRCVDACLAKINIYEDVNTIKKEVGV